MIYKIEYGTPWKIPCRAVVAASDVKEAEGLLEKAVKQDTRIDKIAREKQIKIDNLKIEVTDYCSNKKGVIYFG